MHYISISSKQRFVRNTSKLLQLDDWIGEPNQSVVNWLDSLTQKNDSFMNCYFSHEQVKKVMADQD